MGCLSWVVSSLSEMTRRSPWRLLKWLTMSSWSLLMPSMPYKVIDGVIVDRVICQNTIVIKNFYTNVENVAWKCRSGNRKCSMEMSKWKRAVPLSPIHLIYVTYQEHNEAWICAFENVVCKISAILLIYIWQLCQDHDAMYRLYIVIQSPISLYVYDYHHYQYYHTYIDVPSRLKIWGYIFLCVTTGAASQTPYRDRIMVMWISLKASSMAFWT